MRAVSNLTSVPEQGQMVMVRQRRYVVTDILPSSLPPPPLGGYAQIWFSGCDVQVI
jgi:hypothetical protein